MNSLSFNETNNKPNTFFENVVLEISSKKEYVSSIREEEMKDEEFKNRFKDSKPGEYIIVKNSERNESFTIVILSRYYVLEKYSFSIDVFSRCVTLEKYSLKSDFFNFEQLLSYVTENSMRIIELDEILNREINLYDPLLDRDTAEEKIQEIVDLFPFSSPFIFRPSSQKNTTPGKSYIAFSIWDDGEKPGKKEMNHHLIVYDQEKGFHCVGEEFYLPYLSAIVNYFGLDPSDSLNSCFIKKEVVEGVLQKAKKIECQEKQKMWEFVHEFNQEIMTFSKGIFGCKISKSTNVTAKNVWTPWRSPYDQDGQHAVLAKEGEEEIAKKWTANCQQICFEETKFNRIDNGLLPIFNHFPELKMLILKNVDCCNDGEVININGNQWKQKDSGLDGYLELIAKEVKKRKTSLSFIVIYDPKESLTEDYLVQFGERYPQLTVKIVR